MDDSICRSNVGPCDQAVFRSTLPRTPNIRSKCDGSFCKKDEEIRVIQSWHRLLASLDISKLDSALNDVVQQNGFEFFARQWLFTGYAQSAMTAVEMARASDSIVFAPSVVANEVHWLGLILNKMKSVLACDA